MTMHQWNEHSFFYTDHIEVPLPPQHRFPMMKYKMLRLALQQESVLNPNQLFASTPALDEDLLRAHSSAYVYGLKNHTLTDKELRPIGLPWSEELRQRSYHSVGGFINATDSSLETGFSALLAGGTHHAHFDRGEGYCVFNDFAVAGLRLIHHKKVKKILIIDLDVHQGNGNSSILGQREDFFILSLHGEKNYPFRKIPSHLDIALPEKVKDDEYLESLKLALKEIEFFNADIIFYQAGVDILSFDTLGTFDISFEGIKQRDKLVFEFARSKGLPIAMAIGGGYSNPIEHTIRAHVNTFIVAKDFFK
jgi:acetoin utilization deacetylase AcuC-like enzyme